MPRAKLKPTANAAWQRAYRDRVKRGLVILPLPVRRKTLERLRAAGLVTGEQCAPIFEWAVYERLRQNMPLSLTPKS